MLLRFNILNSYLIKSMILIINFILRYFCFQLSIRRCYWLLEKYRPTIAGLILLNSEIVITRWYHHLCLYNAIRWWTDAAVSAIIRPGVFLINESRRSQQMPLFQRCYNKDTLKMLDKMCYTIFKHFFESLSQKRKKKLLPNKKRVDFVVDIIASFLEFRTQLV